MTEGPIHTNHTQWCLQEKQIGTTNNPNSENLPRPFKGHHTKNGNETIVHTKSPQKSKTQQVKTTPTAKTHPPTTCHHNHAANQIRNHATRHPRKNNRKNTPKAANRKFGFCTNPNFSTHHNSTNALSKMPTWYYFSHPSNLAFHDFTKKHKPQKELLSLLSLGLKVIPTPTLTNSWKQLKQSSYERLFCSIHLWFHFATKPTTEGTEEYDPKLYIKSNWTLPHWTIPPVALKECLSCFSTELEHIFKHQKGKTNILPHQHHTLKLLQQQQHLLITPCNKNLGPTIIECHDYLLIAIHDHLQDKTTYKRLTIPESKHHTAMISSTIADWLNPTTRHYPK